jgi:pilus assembly protein CpaB
MRRRLVLLAVAAVIAAIGAGLVALYVSGSSAPAAAVEDPARVLTATGLISPGESAAQAQAEGKIELTAVPKANVVPGALTSVAPVSGQVALFAIYPGEQILAARFGTTEASQQTLAVPNGKVAVSVELTDPGRVAGFVTPGSHVAVFVTFTASGDPTQPSSFTRVLVPDVEVLAVGPTTVVTQTDPAADPSADGVAQTVLTVALVQRDADRVIFASTNNVLSFGLLGKGTKITPDPGVTQQDLLK